MSIKRTCNLNKPHFQCGEYMMIQGLDDRLIRCGLCHPSVSLASSAIAKPTAAVPEVVPIPIVEAPKPVVEVVSIPVAKPVVEVVPVPIVSKVVTVGVKPIATQAVIPVAEPVDIEKKYYDDTVEWNRECTAQMQEEYDAEHGPILWNWCGKCQKLVQPGMTMCPTCGGGAIDYEQAHVAHTCLACGARYDRKASDRMCRFCDSLVNGRIDSMDNRVIIELDIPAAFDARIVFNDGNYPRFSTLVLAGDSRALMIADDPNALSYVGLGDRYTRSWYNGKWHLESIDIHNIVRRMRLTSLREVGSSPRIRYHIGLAKVSFETGTEEPNN